MEKGSNNLRDRLLSTLPQPANYEAYREEVATALAKRERRLTWVRWGARVFWLYVIAIGMVAWFRGEKWLLTPHGHMFEFGSIVLFICGSLELMKYFLSSTRFEILKEVKQLQLQVLELQSSLPKQSNQPS
jgi:hypothetical protein